MDGSIWFKNWPGDGSESKHVATFVIDNKICCVLTEPTLRIFSENTSGWLQLKKDVTRWFLKMYNSEYKIDK